MLVRWSLAVALAAGAACGSGPKPVPPPAPAAPPPPPAVVQPIEVALVADARLNPNERGQSLPTIVRVYQLKSPAKLENAEYDRVYRDAKDVLGDDLIRVEEVVISPAETVKRRLDRDGATRWVAAVAVFRRPAGLSWRVIAELPPPEKAVDLTYAVEDSRIERR